MCNEFSYIYLIEYDVSMYALNLLFMHWAFDNLLVQSDNLQKWQTFSSLFMWVPS